jgi:hypothetical protein
MDIDAVRQQALQARNIHAFQHHGGHVQCYTDCPTCLAMQRVAMSLKAAPEPVPTLTRRHTTPGGARRR